MPQNHLQLVDQGLPELGHLSVPLVLLQLLLQLGERLRGFLQPRSGFLELPRVAFLKVGQTPSPLLLPRLQKLNRVKSKKEPKTNLQWQGATVAKGASETLQMSLYMNEDYDEQEQEDENVMMIVECW